MYPSFYASATLARNVRPGKPLLGRLLFSDFRSAYTLDKVYKNSTLNIAKEIEIPKAKDGEFSGYIPIDQLEITYSKSSGPGGQNVNKVNSKVDVRFHVATAKWLSESIKAKILEKHKNDLNKDGFLIVRSERARTQTVNVADCLIKIRKLIHCAINSSSKKPDSEEFEMIKLARHEKAARERLRIKRERAITKQGRQDPILND